MDLALPTKVDMLENPKQTKPNQPKSYLGIKQKLFGGARGVMVIVVGNGHGDTSSNPGRD